MFGTQGRAEALTRITLEYIIFELERIIYIYIYTLVLASMNTTTRSYYELVLDSTPYAYLPVW
jgi:hypothetical protein